MQIVYFIQSHKNPAQVYRLVDVIKQSSSDSLVLLSHDFSSCSLDSDRLKQYSGVELIKRTKSARRGDKSVLEIYLDAVNWLYNRDRDFDWLVCLSGQDYPIQPIADIEAFLANTEYDGFIQHWEVLSDDSPWGRLAGHKRFYAQYVSLPQRSKWWLKKVCYIEPLIPALQVQWRFASIGLAAISIPFNDSFKCYGGWYWNTLSRKCLDFLKSYLEEHSDLWQFYRRTLAPEESLPATVLLNSDRFNLCNDCLRYLKFPSDLFGYAQSLTVDDYPQLVRSKAHFARKFDSESDSEILDLLDKRLFNQSHSASFCKIASSREC